MNSPSSRRRSSRVRRWHWALGLVLFILQCCNQRASGGFVPAGTTATNKATPARYQRQSPLNSPASPSTSSSSTSLSLSLPKFISKRTRRRDIVEKPDDESSTIAPPQKKRLRSLMRRSAALLLAASFALSGGPNGAVAVDPFYDDPLVVNDTLVPTIQRPIEAYETYEEVGEESAVNTDTNTPSNKQKKPSFWKSKFSTKSQTKLRDSSLLKTTTQNNQLPSKATVAALVVATGVGGRLSLRLLQGDGVGDENSLYLQRKRRQQREKEYNNKMVKELLAKTEQSREKLAELLLGGEDQETDDFLFPFSSNNSTIMTPTSSAKNEQQLILSNQQRAIKSKTNQLNKQGSKRGNSNNNKINNIAVNTPNGVNLLSPQIIERRSLQAKVKATKALRDARTLRQNMTAAGYAQLEELKEQMRKDLESMEVRRQSAHETLEQLSAKRAEMKQRTLLAARLQMERSARLRQRQEERRQAQKAAEEKAVLRRQQEAEKAEQERQALLSAQRQERICRKLMEERFHRALIDSLCRKREERQRQYEQRAKELVMERAPELSNGRSVVSTSAMDTTMKAEGPATALPFYANRQRRAVFKATSVQYKLEEVRKTLEDTKKTLLAKRDPEALEMILSQEAKKKDSELEVQRIMPNEENERVLDKPDDADNVPSLSTKPDVKSTSQSEVEVKHQEKTPSIKRSHIKTSPRDPESLKKAEATSRALLKSRLTMEQKVKFLQNEQQQKAKEESTLRALLKSRLDIEAKELRTHREQLRKTKDEATNRGLLQTRLSIEAKERETREEEEQRMSAEIEARRKDEEERLRKEAVISKKEDEECLRQELEQELEQKARAEATSRSLLKRRLIIESNEEEQRQKQKLEATSRALLKARLDLEARAKADLQTAAESESAARMLREARDDSLLNMVLGLEDQPNVQSNKGKSLLDMVMTLEAQDKVFKEEATQRKLLEARSKLEVSDRNKRANQSSIDALHSAKPMTVATAAAKKNMFQTSKFLQSLQTEAGSPADKDSLNATSSTKQRQESLWSEKEAADMTAKAATELQSAINETVVTEQKASKQDASPSNQSAAPTAEWMPGLRVVVSKAKRKQSQNTTRGVLDRPLP